MDKVYVAIIGDIVNSRNLDDREAMQIKLSDSLKIINNLFEKYLEANVDFTTGDEIEGLFNDISAANAAIQLLMIMTHQFQMRFGIGIGELSISQNDNFNKVNMLDGKCFHNARKAINSSNLKKGGIVFYNDNGYMEIISSINMQFYNDFMSLSNPVKSVYYDLTILNPAFVTNIIDNDKWNSIFGVNTDFNHLNKHGLISEVAKKMNKELQSVHKAISRNKLINFQMFQKAINDVAKIEFYKNRRL